MRKMTEAEIKKKTGTYQTDCASTYNADIIFP